jgi:hypothetical protein
MHEVPLSVVVTQPRLYIQLRLMVTVPHNLLHPENIWPKW